MNETKQNEYAKKAKHKEKKLYVKIIAFEFHFYLKFMHSYILYILIHL